MNDRRTEEFPPSPAAAWARRHGSSVTTAPTEFDTANASTEVDPVRLAMRGLPVHAKVESLDLRLDTPAASLEAAIYLNDRVSTRAWWALGVSIFAILLSLGTLVLLVLHAWAHG